MQEFLSDLTATTYAGIVNVTKIRRGTDNSPDSIPLVSQRSGWSCHTEKEPNLACVDNTKFFLFSHSSFASFSDLFFREAASC